MLRQDLEECAHTRDMDQPQIRFSMEWIYILFCVNFGNLNNSLAIPLVESDA